MASYDCEWFFFAIKHKEFTDVVVTTLSSSQITLHNGGSTTVPPFCSKTL